MSPLAAPPIRGYPDYQRVGNYDTGIEWLLPTGVTSLPQTSPVMDCSRFAYTQGRLWDQIGSHQETWSWSAAGDMSEIVGQRTFVISINTANYAQIHLPNLSAFLQVALHNVGGVNYAAAGGIVFTNRVHPLEFIPQYQSLVDSQNATIAAGGNNIYYPIDYYAGPVRVWSFGNQPYQWTATWLNNSGTWDIFDQIPQQAVNTALTLTTVTPPGAWRIQLNNAGGVAGSFWLAVTATTTGAS